MPPITDVHTLAWEGRAARMDFLLKRVRGNRSAAVSSAAARTRTHARVVLVLYRDAQWHAR